MREAQGSGWAQEALGRACICERSKDEGHSGNTRVLEVEEKIAEEAAKASRHRGSFGAGLGVATSPELLVIPKSFSLDSELEGSPGNSVEGVGG